MLFKTKILLVLSIILSTISFSHATIKYGDKVEKTVSPNQKIMIQSMYMVGTLCGSPAPLFSTQTNPKYGTLTSDSTFSKIDLTKNLKGDGHQFCDKETGKTLVYYTAGSSTGVDKFTIAFTHGGADTILIDVVVNIVGTKKTENNTVNTNTINIPKTSEVPTNPIFESVKTGSSYTYSTENFITGKKGTFYQIVSDKKQNDFSTVSGSGLIIYNPKFERIKTPEWKHQNRTCDGINYPLVVGAYEKFNHSGTYIKDGASNNRVFLCERKTIGKKTISVMGKTLEGWIIENTHTSKWNNGDNAVYKWNGVFSEDINAWLEVNITEKIEDRIVLNLGAVPDNHLR
jgi:hypothetical protein